MAYYVDFVGLNTFIYEPVGWDAEEQGGFEIVSQGGGDSISVSQNTINFLQPFQMAYLKNYLFSHNLPNTASFFPALMLRRNGPYGYNSFKQIRIGQNPLTRKQIQNNVFTFVTEPGPEIVINNKGRQNTIRGRYGAIQKFTETPVYSHSKPFLVGAGTFDVTGTLQRFEVVGAYGSETNFFNNEEVNKYYNKRLRRSRQYSTISGFYLNGGLNQDGSPIDSFEYFKYRECVYPSKIYAYKNYVRQRTTFSFPWRDDRQNRTEEVDDNGFGSHVTQSVWPLDAYSKWDTGTSTANRWGNVYGYNRNDSLPRRDQVDYGILQNQYSFGEDSMALNLRYGALDGLVRVAPVYNRKHTITISSSVVSPNGMNIEGINTGTTMGNMGSDSKDGVGIPGGEAKWEAGSQSGLNPFYDTYDNYIQGVRQYGKDYSIIPEFRISDHVETYQSKGITEEITNLFSLTGALSDTTDSSKTDFYKIYSNSEFMKHFEVIKKDHDGFVPPTSITLKCKAIKKLLPYDGFYPAQRSVELAKQFYSSYKDFVAVSGSEDVYGSASSSPALFQNLMVPMFAPGVLFNTIKSGIACDYPLKDENLSFAANNITSSDGNFYINANGFFHRRIPFEALLEPERYLALREFYCNEPHRYANNSGSVVWDGNGNNLYKLMAHNFIAETTEFFMKSKNMSTIISKPSNDPNVGYAEAGKTYMMRIKMYKSKNTAKLPIISGSSGFYNPPQYPSASTETFTMYSRPTAFGPPARASSGSGGSAGWSENGENYLFTPPYYYGEAWCDVMFTASDTKKHSISEIIQQSTIKQWRYAEATDVDTYAKSVLLNGGIFPIVTASYSYRPDDFYNTLKMGLAMHLNASVNMFRQTTAGDAGSDPSDVPSQWVIQTKFETPMLNFNHLSASDSVTLPSNASQSVPRGMWHQYGNIEEDPTKGVFLQVDDVPPDWIDNWLSQDSETTGSLVNLCGFSTEAVKLGQVASEKTISEAVVAVPFVEQDGERKFFRLKREDIERAQRTSQERALVGATIERMVARMKKYVFPPSMDFVKYNSIDPFAMYIFEFSHVLKKQDLANIWQNLYPQIGQTFETAESTISHELLAHELLGGGAVLGNDGTNVTLNVNAIGNELPDRVQWMVFKVKQRAETNYYNKLIGRQVDDFGPALMSVDNSAGTYQNPYPNVAEIARDQQQQNQPQVTSEGLNTDLSYNWPYDFFSLVELAKIESEVEFSERAEKSVVRIPLVRNEIHEPIGDVTARLRTTNEAIRSGRLDPASTQIGTSPNTPATTQASSTDTENTGGY